LLYFEGLLQYIVDNDTTKKFVKYDGYLEYKMTVLTVIFYAYGGCGYRHISCHNE